MWNLQIRIASFMVETICARKQSAHHKCADVGIAKPTTNHTTFRS
jgi:hypothetical protein